MTELNKEYEFYKQHRNELLESHRGKFLIIKDQKLVGVYETEAEAYQAAIKKYELGTFLLQECLEETNEQKAIFHTQVIFG